MVVLSFRGLARRRDGLLYGLTSLMIVSLASYPLNLLPFCILLVFFYRGGSGRWSFGKSDFRRSSPSRCFRARSRGRAAPYPERKSDTGLCRIGELLQGAYQLQDYRFVAGEYEELYPELCDEPRFLFEYGHALNKSERYFSERLGAAPGRAFQRRSDVLERDGK